jgi:hypothetical protein
MTLYANRYSLRLENVAALREIKNRNYAQNHQIRSYSTLSSENRR